MVAVDWSQPSIRCKTHSRPTRRPSSLVSMKGRHFSSMEKEYATCSEPATNMASDAVFSASNCHERLRTQDAETSRSTNDWQTLASKTTGDERAAALQPGAGCAGSGAVIDFIWTSSWVKSDRTNKNQQNTADLEAEARFKLVRIEGTCSRRRTGRRHERQE
jgi:hypothetical protein